jgi:nucleoside-diphosphate-sugar epimerase
MTPDRRVAAVTGASGFLGSRICGALEDRGWLVRRLVRSPRPGDEESRRYVIDEPLDPNLLRSTDLLVHAAYDFGARSRKDIWHINVEGSRRLMEAARDAGVGRVIAISTMSAYEGTSQLYGQAKLEIERYVSSIGGCAIRPGLVYSREPAGMAGALMRVTRLPLVPLIAGGAHQFTVHLDDLIAAVVTIAEAEAVVSRPIGIAHPAPVSFRSVLSGLAALEGRRCRFVPVPWQAVYGGLRLMERLGLRPAFRADSLLGLVRPAPFVAGTEQVASLGITLRRFGDPPADAMESHV